MSEGRLVLGRLQPATWGHQRPHPCKGFQTANKHKCTQPHCSLPPRDGVPAPGAMNSVSPGWLQCLLSHQHAQNPRLQAGSSGGWPRTPSLLPVPAAASRIDFVNAFGADSILFYSISLPLAPQLLPRQRVWPESQKGPYVTYLGAQRKEDRALLRADVEPAFSPARAGTQVRILADLTGSLRLKVSTMGRVTNPRPSPHHPYACTEE